MEFFLLGHLEGQAHARLNDEQAAGLAARIQFALEAEAEHNRRLAKNAAAFIDVAASRAETARANTTRSDSRPQMVAR